jgi:hypothetical protein
LPPESGLPLGERIDANARRVAIEKWGEPTPEQFKLARDCEWDMFTFHAATGGDAECYCGAHEGPRR